MREAPREVSFLRRRALQNQPHVCWLVRIVTLHYINLNSLVYTIPLSSPEETVAQLETFLLNRFGIPSDLKQQYTVRKTRLIFIPIRLYTVQVSLNSTIFN